MNRIKLLPRLLASLLIMFTLGMALTTASASAADVFPACSGSAKNTDVCKEISPGKPGSNPIIRGLKVAIGIITAIVGIASVIMIIVAGLSFITANGDAQAVARARSSIIYALVGIVVVILAQTLVVLVLNKV